MSFKYQMHAHTYPCSACAKRSVEELVESLHSGGYQGCVLTNHFLNGNCGIDRKLSWTDFVKKYEDDYIRGKSLAEKYDLDFLFGIEEGVGNGLEILCYGITPQFLYDNPHLAFADVKAWHEALESCGALAIQSHPFRNRHYIPKPGILAEEYIDGIEVLNYENMSEDNERAKIAATGHSEWILISGADTHSNDTTCHGGIECDERIRNEKELAELLKSRNYRLIED